MQDAISAVVDRKSIAPLVRFERIAVKDAQASLSSGQYVAKDVDYAFITPPYSKDEVVKKAKTFLEDNRVKVERGQLPAETADRYRRQYEAWKEGQELPLEGTPIKGWAMISPAQQAMLIDRKIPTVEMLAQANDEGMRNIGMGGMSMKKMAQGWIDQAKEKGPLSTKIASVESENTVLKGSIETLMKQVAALQEVAKIQPSMPPLSPSRAITVEDILPDEELKITPPRKR